MGNKSLGKDKTLSRSATVSDYFIYDFDKEVSEFSNLLNVICKKLMKLKIKKKNEFEKKRKDIVEILKSSKSDYEIEAAKIKTEFLMRDEGLAKVFELLSEVCQIACQNVSYLLNSGKINKTELAVNNKLKLNLFTYSTPPDDARHLIDTILYASARIDIDEFVKLREIVKNKFGSLYLENASINAYKKGNDKIVKLLSLDSLPIFNIIERLNSIAIEEKINIKFPESWFKHSLNLDLNMKGDSNANTNTISNRNGINYTT